MLKTVEVSINKIQDQNQIQELIISWKKLIIIYQGYFLINFLKKTNVRKGIKIFDGISQKKGGDVSWLRQGSSGPIDYQMLQ